MTVGRRGRAARRARAARPARAPAHDERRRCQSTGGAGATATGAAGSTGMTGAASARARAADWGQACHLDRRCGRLAPTGTGGLTVCRGRGRRGAHASKSGGCAGSPAIQDWQRARAHRAGVARTRGATPSLMRRLIMKRPRLIRVLGASALAAAVAGACAPWARARSPSRGPRSMEKGDLSEWTSQTNGTIASRRRRAREHRAEHRAPLHGQLLSCKVDGSPRRRLRQVPPRPRRHETRKHPHG